MINDDVWQFARDFARASGDSPECQCVSCRAYRAVHDSDSDNPARQVRVEDDLWHAAEDAAKAEGTTRTALETAVGVAYLAVADLTEATISPAHAVDVAEWHVRAARPLRSRLQRALRGHDRAWWQAQALREHLAREDRGQGNPDKG